jgi:hypothetical protein
MEHSEYIKNSRNELKKIITNMLTDNADVLSGIRAVNSFRYEIDAPDPEMFKGFIAFNSETDHFPVGVFRDNYSSAALQRVDEEILEFLSEAKDEILDEARCFLEKLDKLK